MTAFMNEQKHISSPKKAVTRWNREDNDKMGDKDDQAKKVDTKFEQPNHNF